MIININDKDYSGAGVLIIEDYIDHKKNKIPSLLLVRNKATQLFTDFGGIHEKKHKTLEMTASSELNEESRNLIQIDPEILSKQNYIDIIANKKRNIYYRIYIIKINGICRKYYHHNREIIDNSDAKKYFKETDDITHLPIKNIDFNKIKNLRCTIKDVYKNNIKLNTRLKNVLSNSYDIIKDMIDSKPISTQKDFKLKKGLFNKKTYILSIN